MDVEFASAAVGPDSGHLQTEALEDEGDGPMVWFDRGGGDVWFGEEVDVVAESAACQHQPYISWGKGGVGGEEDVVIGDGGGDGGGYLGDHLSIAPGAGRGD